MDKGSNKRYDEIECRKIRWNGEVRQKQDVGIINTVGLFERHIELIYIFLNILLLSTIVVKHVSRAFALSFSSFLMTIGGVTHVGIVRKGKLLVS